MACAPTGVARRWSNDGALGAPRPSCPCVADHPADRPRRPLPARPSCPPQPTRRRWSARARAPSRRWQRAGDGGRRRVRAATGAVADADRPPIVGPALPPPPRRQGAPALCRPSCRRRRARRWRCPRRRATATYGCHRGGCAGLVEYRDRGRQESKGQAHATSAGVRGSCKTRWTCATHTGVSGPPSCGLFSYGPPTRRGRPRWCVGRAHIE